MVYLDVYNNMIEEVNKILVKDAVFNVNFNEVLVHQIVNSFVMNVKVGTKAQKTRSDVRGGGKKPWMQKTTGRARAGSIRSPLWRGGGKIFASKPYKKVYKINKKMYKLSMCNVLSELVRQKRFFCFKNFELVKPDTNYLQETFSKIPGKNKLCITNKCCVNVYKSSLNLKNICFLDVDRVNILDLLKFETVVIFDSAVDQLVERVCL